MRYQLRYVRLNSSSLFDNQTLAPGLRGLQGVPLQSRARSALSNSSAIAASKSSQEYSVLGGTSW